MSRKNNDPPEVNKPSASATKEVYTPNDTSSTPASNTNGNTSSPPTYSQATYASIPSSSSSTGPAAPVSVPPQYGSNPVYMVPPNQNVVVVQGPSAYYANPRAQRLADGNVPCVQCGSPYPLPGGATSFRCRQCGKFNNTRGDQCQIL